MDSLQYENRQVTTTNAAEIAIWINDNGGNGSIDALSNGVFVSTPVEDLMAYPGDWVILTDGKFSVLASRRSDDS